MDPLHATMEEFAADGYTHVECFGPRCRMKTEADKLASSNLDGTYHRAAFSTATLCGAHYRGYMIEGEKERRGWLVHVSPERPELPILRHADFHVTDKTWTQAVVKRLHRSKHYAENGWLSVPQRRRLQLSPGKE